MIDHGFGVYFMRLEAVFGAFDRTYKWRNDPRVMKWTRQCDLLCVAAHDEWFKKQACDPTLQMYAVIVPGDPPAHVGVAGLTSLDLINRRAEFSLYIGPEHQDKGHGSAALMTLLSHGFQTYGLRTIWGETFAANPAAKLFEELGMKKEGSRRDHYYRDGAFIDCHLYSLLRPEWDRLLPTWREKRAIQAGPTEGLPANVVSISTTEKPAPLAPEPGRTA